MTYNPALLRRHVSWDPPPSNSCSDSPMTNSCYALLVLHHPLAANLSNNNSKFVPPPSDQTIDALHLPCSSEGQTPSYSHSKYPHHVPYRCLEVSLKVFLDSSSSSLPNTTVCPPANPNSSQLTSFIVILLS